MQLKTLLSILSVTVILSFTACGTPERTNSNSNTSSAEESLQDNSTPSVPASGEAAPSEAASVQPDPSESAATPSPQEKSAANTPNLSVLSDSIQNLEQRIEGITPSGSAQEQKDQFFLLKNEIDALDHELEYTEDDLESQYRSGSLEASVYQEQEWELEALEDRLDHCEDQLEFIFKMDD